MKEDVIKYEKILNKSKEIVSNLEEQLNILENNISDYKELYDYYFSDEFIKDYELSENTDLYDDILCGVLSQDSVSNLMIDNRNISIKMLEIATKLLKI